MLLGAELDTGGAGELGVVEAATGHTVVYRAIVEVTTVVELAGQLVTVAGHLVIVSVAVV